MNPVNPYQASEYSASAGEGGRSSKHVYRDEVYAVARHLSATFPAACVVCGDDESCRPMSCTVRAKPGLLQFIIPIAGIFSPSVSVKPSLCERHRKKESRWRLGGHLMLLAAISLILIPFSIVYTIPAAADEIVLITLAGLPMAYAWVYYRIFRPRIGYAKQIQKSHAWIEGVHDGVLDQLPPLPSPSRS